MQEAWFIRHGQSESNAGLSTTAPHLTAITPVGALQSEAIARSIGIEPNLIVTSPFLRARQTAAQTRAAYPNVPFEQWPVQEFTYLSSKKYRGTTFAQRRPMTREYWLRLDPTYRDGNDAETFAELFERIGATLARLRLAEGLTLIFSHGQFMRAIAWRALGDLDSADQRAMRSFSLFRRSLSVPNGAVLKLRFGPGDQIWMSDVITTHIPSEMTTK